MTTDFESCLFSHDFVLSKARSGPLAQRKWDHQVLKETNAFFPLWVVPYSVPRKLILSVRTEEMLTFATTHPYNTRQTSSVLQKKASSNPNFNKKPNLICVCYYLLCTMFTTYASLAPFVFFCHWFILSFPRLSSSILLFGWPKRCFQFYTNCHNDDNIQQRLKQTHLTIRVLVLSKLFHFNLI